MVSSNTDPQIGDRIIITEYVQHGSAPSVDGLKGLIGRQGTIYDIDHNCCISTGGCHEYNTCPYDGIHYRVGLDTEYDWDGIPLDEVSICYFKFKLLDKPEKICNTGLRRSTKIT